MQTLKSFPAYHTNPGVLTSAMSRYLNSAEFREHVAQVQNDDYVRARLTISLLEHVSLEPAGGYQTVDFVRDHFLLPKPGQVSVYLKFFKVTNFIGSFTIATSSPEMQQLLAAISKNVGSRMFKAATTRRRMEGVLTRRVGLIRNRAGKAREVAMNAVLDAENPQPPGKWVRPSTDLIERASAAAATAYNAVFDPARERLDRRMQAVEAQAAHPDYRGSFYEIQTAFAAKYLAPASLNQPHTLQ